MTPAALVVVGLASLAATATTGSPASVHRRLRRIVGPAEPGTARRRRHVAVTAVGACAVLLLVGGPGLLLGVLAVTLVVAGVTLRVRAARREQAGRAAAVELCRALAAELRAGRAPPAAFVAAVGSAAEPLRALLRPAVDVAARGDAAELADAVALAASEASSSGLSASSGLEGLHRLVACWRVAATSGAALAPAIDRVGDGLQADVELERALATSLAGPRATVRLLAALPVMGLLLGTAIGAHPIRFLLASDGGLACCGAAVLLDGAGVAWSRRIARRAATSLG